MVPPRVFGVLASGKNPSSTDSLRLPGSGSHSHTHPLSIRGWIEYFISVFAETNPIPLGALWFFSGFR